MIQFDENAPGYAERCRKILGFVDDDADCQYTKNPEQLMEKLQFHIWEFLDIDVTNPMIMCFYCRAKKMYDAFVKTDKLYREGIDAPELPVYAPSDNVRSLQDAANMFSSLLQLLAAALTQIEESKRDREPLLRIVSEGFTQFRKIFVKVQDDQEKQRKRAEKLSRDGYADIKARDCCFNAMGQYFLDSNAALAIKHQVWKEIQKTGVQRDLQGNIGG